MTKPAYEMITEEQIVQAAKILREALFDDQEIVIDAVEKNSPTYFGLTLKTIAESKRP